MFVQDHHTFLISFTHVLKVSWIYAYAHIEVQALPDVDVYDYCSAFNKHRRPTKSVGKFAQRSWLLSSWNWSNIKERFLSNLVDTVGYSTQTRLPASNFIETPAIGLPFGTLKMSRSLLLIKSGAQRVRHSLQTNCTHVLWYKFNVALS